MSPWGAPLSRQKYVLVFPLLMTQDSWFFKRVFIPKWSFYHIPIYLKQMYDLSESNAFSISTAT